MPRGRRMAVLLSILIVAYAALVVAVIWWLVAARRWALSEMATPVALEQWEAWRSDVREQQGGSSPVRRSVPKSAEPPMLVLLRDHFVVLVAGAIVFSSLLYWITAWFFQGLFRTPDNRLE